MYKHKFGQNQWLRFSYWNVNTVFIVINQNITITVLGKVTEELEPSVSRSWWIVDAIAANSRPLHGYGSRYFTLRSPKMPQFFYPSLPFSDFYFWVILVSSVRLNRVWRTQTSHSLIYFFLPLFFLFSSLLPGTFCGQCHFLIMMI